MSSSAQPEGPGSAGAQSRAATPRAGGAARLRLWLLSLLAGLAAATLVWAAGEYLLAREAPLLANLSGAVYDLGMTEFARPGGQGEAAAGPVAVVQINETSRKRFEQLVLEDEIRSANGEQPRFSLPGVRGAPSFRLHQRAFHARLVENLRRLGAKVVVFDLLFSDGDPLDTILAKAIRRHGRVLLAAVNEQQRIEGGRAEQTIDVTMPTAVLREASAGIGMANVKLDADETVRRFRWWFTGLDPDTAEDTEIPSLGVAAAALFTGQSPQKVVRAALRPTGAFDGHRIIWEPDEIDRDARVSFIRYFGPAGRPAGPDSVVRYEDVLEAFGPTGDADAQDQLRRRVAGRLVFVGSSSAVDQDLHRVPVRTRYQARESDQTMPGVETQAAVAQTVMSGLYLRRAGRLPQLALLFGACAVIALIGRLFNPSILLIASLLGVLALVQGSGQMLVRAGWWLDPIPAVLGIGVSALLESVVMFLGERRARLKVKRQLSRHVGPGVAEKLTDDEWPDLAGESVEITMLFSDLQGFTSLSETMNSQEICRLLNSYFGVMFPVLFRHGGTVDKLMGDGMMAYFGWPIRSADHAAAAVRCAVEMQAVLAEWKSRPENHNLPPLRTRVGIHSGLCTVGGIGSGEREEFTVIGDVVNVASRLEGMNKEFGTLILVSDATRSLAGEIAPMTARGQAQVRGRKEPMPVFSVDTGLE